MPKGKWLKKVLHRDAFTVPLKSNPPGKRCFQIEIPDDNQWEESLFSCLSLLGKWNSYQQDGGHKAADVAQVWREILYFGGITRCKKIAVSNGVELEDVSRIRVNPDNPCQIQIECKPDEWELFLDVAECARTNVSQPVGGGVLEPGESRDYCLTINGNGQTLLPVPVTSGYKLEFSGFSGGWTDGVLGPLAPWYCARGEAYLAATCSGGTHAHTGDPLDTVPHMSIVGNINDLNQWFRTDAGPIIIPAGVSGSNIIFQANDDVIGDNVGSVTMCVKVTAVTEETFTHVFNFSEGSGGFTHGWPIDGRGDGTWVPGTGWNGDNVTADDYECIIHLDFSTRVIKTVAAVVSFSVANSNRNTIAALDSTLGPAGVAGTAEDYFWDLGAGGAASTISIGIGSGGNTDPEGQFALTSMTVTGMGTDPF